MVRQIDSRIGDDAKLKGFVVLLSDKAEGDRNVERLKRLADQHKVKHVPLTIVRDPEGPGDYELNKSAEVTVLMWRGGQVKVNHVFKEFKEGDVGKVLKDLPKILEK